jgi:RNA polymerase subunit RPABC4/transcription elongation factor Spt4
VLIERVCDVCKGRAYFESWDGTVMACIACHGSGIVMTPDDEDCKLMIERVMKESK